MAPKRFEDIMIEMKQVALIHAAVVTLIVLPLAAFSSMQQARDGLLAGVLVGLNLAAILWTMKRILLKKSIARAGSVIVIKYAVFIAILVALHASGWRLGIGFVLGLSSALPTMVWSAYRHLKQSELNGSI